MVNLSSILDNYFHYIPFASVGVYFTDSNQWTHFYIQITHHFQKFSSINFQLLSFVKRPEIPNEEAK